MRALGDTWLLWLKWKYSWWVENRLLEQPQKGVNRRQPVQLQVGSSFYQKSKTPARITSANPIIFRGCLSIFCNTKFPEAAREDLLRPKGSVSLRVHRAESGMDCSVPTQLPNAVCRHLSKSHGMDLIMFIHSSNLLENPSGLFCVVELRPNLLFIFPLVTAKWCCLRAPRFISAPHKVSMKFITSITQGRDKQHHQSGCLRTSQDWLFYKTSYIWGSEDLIKKLNALGRVNSSINLFDVYVNRVAKANSTNICP